MKSAFLYQFTKYIEWPASANPFVIGVIDDEQLAKVLTDVTAKKTAGVRPIVVQSFTAAGAGLESADILIFPKNNSAVFEAVSAKLKGKPCLTVAHAEGMAAKGSTINFFMSDDRMRFELNQKALTENALKISDTLLKLAKVVN